MSPVTARILEVFLGFVGGIVSGGILVSIYNEGRIRNLFDSIDFWREEFFRAKTQWDRFVFFAKSYGVDPTPDQEGNQYILLGGFSMALPNGTVLKDPDQKQKIWKPEEVGETVFGKLFAIDFGKKDLGGKLLRFQLLDGTTLSVPIWKTIEDINWPSYIGREFVLEFRGVAGKANYKKIRVILCDSTDAPF